MLRENALGCVNARDAREWAAWAKRGDFARAWVLSDRIRARNLGAPDWSRPRHLQQVWNGGDLRDRRVLIRCYHGLGDTIQFIRYAPLVRSLAREVIVWAQPDLLSVLSTAAGIHRLMPLHDGSPDAVYDVDAEIMELPYAFRTTLATIPNAVPYLSAEPARLPGAGPRIGVAWRAGSWDERRSIPFEFLAALFDRHPVSWYRLQVGVAAGEQHQRLRPLVLSDVLCTAQVMCALDLVITIDSMPAHLAGALGIPVWTLLMHDADWRWMAGRTDSPWYPSMRLFRQHRPGSWHGVVEEVDEALDRVLHTPGRHRARKNLRGTP